MKHKKFFISIIVVLLIAAGGYGYMGGFNQPEIKQVLTSETYIAGKAYHGSVKSEAFGDLFREVGKLAEEKKISGDPGGIYYNNPENENDSIQAFIGIIVADSKVALPAGYSIRVLPAGQKALQANLKGHFTMTPNKAYPALFDYAKEQKLALQDVFVERFQGEREAEFLVLLK